MIPLFLQELDILWRYFILVDLDGLQRGQSFSRGKPCYSSPYTESPNNNLYNVVDGGKYSWNGV
jgi:hypothetical protein